MNQTFPPPKVQTLKHYQVLQTIGQGGFSVIYLAYDPSCGRFRAIKSLSKDKLNSEKAIQHFQQEIDTMTIIHHKSLVNVYDVFDDPENYYIVMDYCEGGDLFDYVITHGRISESEAAVVFRQIVEGVATCHSFSVAHRDIKLENILIDTFPHIRIADFGLCGYIQEDRLMSTFCGSLTYCAPECISRQDYDGRISDIWSMGIVLYSLVTGENPWKTSNQTIVMQKIMQGQISFPGYLSSACKNLLQKMLKTEPYERITLQKIAEHPWLEKANSYENYDFEEKLQPLNIPKKRRLSVASLSDHSDSTDNSVIVLPDLSKRNSIDEIEAEENISLAEAITPSLPALINKRHRSQNINLLVASSKQVNTSTSKFIRKRSLVIKPRIMKIIIDPIHEER